MATTRAFAYNATQSTITGTVNAGTICIGVSALDYSSNPGGLTWWMGPDEDSSYVIAKAVSTQNFPTPVGNVGGIEFWKCTNTDEAFRSLVQIISGTSQATASAANIWLISNGFWSSWSFDSEAQAFINAAGITNATEQYAVSNLVLGLKSDSLWTKMFAVYPFVGGSASSHKWNLKDPRDLNEAYRLTFHGDITHGSNGITPGGTLNGYADTKFVPSSVWGLSNSSISAYSRTDSNTGALYGTRNNNSSNSSITFQKTPSYYSFYHSAFANEPLGINTSTGLIGSSRSFGTNIITSWRGNNNTTTGASQATLPSNSIYLCAQNSNPSVFPLYSDKEIAFAHIGIGLTTTEFTNLSTRVQTFQTILNRTAY
jgi:hypothetical protein